MTISYRTHVSTLESRISPRLSHQPSARGLMRESRADTGFEGSARGLMRESRADTGFEG